MKVAVSIPDPIFDKAEALARRMKISRSKVYARALDEFVANNPPRQNLTDQINAVLDEIGEEEIDPFLQEAARQTFKRIEW